MKSLILFLITTYQRTLSPDHGIFKGVMRRRCRYYPSCSVYARDALRQYGLLKGLVVSLKRILRCNQFFDGGYDPAQ